MVPADDVQRRSDATTAARRCARAGARRSGSSQEHRTSGPGATERASNLAEPRPGPRSRPPATVHRRRRTRLAVRTPTRSSGAAADADGQSQHLEPFLQRRRPCASTSSLTARWSSVRAATSKNARAAPTPAISTSATAERPAKPTVASPTPLAASPAAIAGESRRRLASDTRDGRPDQSTRRRTPRPGSPARRAPHVQDLDREERVEDVQQSDQEELCPADAEQERRTGFGAELAEPVERVVDERPRDRPDSAARSRDTAAAGT